MTMRYVNEDNMSLEDTRRVAEEVGAALAVCEICGRPHLWFKGGREGYRKAPTTCGRDACLVTYDDQRGLQAA